MAEIRIEVLMVTHHVEAKINGLHGVTVDDVQQACDAVIRAAWDDDAERGRRLLLTGRTATDRELNVVLYPVDGQPTHWNLATAFY